MVKLLLDNGADANIQDDRGNTALDHANMQGLEEMKELLSV